jgi:hypothetical protein
MGMSPDQMEGFIVNQLELYFQYVDGVQDINTRNIQQVALTELSFFPGTDMGQAMGQVVAMSDRAMSWMPKGTLPPMIMRMDAGSVPVGYLVFESEVTSLGRLGDLAQNVIRPLSPSLDPDDPQSRHYDPLLHAPAEEAQAAAPSLPLPAVAPQRAGIRHAPAGGPAFRAVTNVPPETVVWHGDL